MGLFGNLFDKKVCCACGEDIGLLGNRKLADGNLCKKCAAKLSPWMTDRKESTVEEILQHLNYRAENEKALSDVRVTRILAHNKVYVDDERKVFFVPSSSNWQHCNPDLIRLDQVISANVTQREYRTELYQKDPQGKNISYNPPRYDTTYAFLVDIKVDSPYFTDIHFEMTDKRPHGKLTPEYRTYEAEAAELIETLRPGESQKASDLLDKLRTAVNSVKTAAGAAEAEEGWLCSCGAKNTGKFCTQCGAPKPEPAPKAEPDEWLCGCGAKNTGKFCTQCGKAKPEPVLQCDACGWKPEEGATAPKFCPQCGKPFGA